MKAHRTTIELNGKLYDAHTGTAIGLSAAPNAKHVSNPPRIPAVQKPGQVVDGIKHRPNTHKNHLERKSSPAIRQSAPKTTRSTPNRRPALAAHHTPQPSRILHRSGVIPPNITSIQKEPTQAAIPVTKQKINSARHKRAQATIKSPSIQRFNHLTKESALVSSHVHDKGESMPLHQTTQTTPDPVHATTVNGMSETKEQLLKRGLEQAPITESPTPHTPQKRQKKTGSKVFKYAAGALSILLISGYVAYLNLPAISLKIASTRAGFNATLPGERPAGYSLRNPIAYSPGQVIINFASNSDGRFFSLTQQPTTWDSQALLENYVTKQSKTHLTYQDRGLTVYIFNGSNAAWVNGGKFYSIIGNNSQLDTDQLLKIATSM